MRIVIWGCGHLSRLLEDYIRQDVEVVAYIDSNEKYLRGGGIWHCGCRIPIKGPEAMRNISFDWCLITISDYQTVVRQCLETLEIPKKKILLADEIFKWDIDLIKGIFNENILGNTRNYNIGGIKIDLGDGHNLPSFQRIYKMYDKFLPYMGEITKQKKGKYIFDIGANVGDSLAAMWNHTDDKFIVIEPVKEFFDLLLKNIERFGNTERVCAERAFITDKIEELFQVKREKGGTAHKERMDIRTTEFIPSKSVDGLLKTKGIAYEDVDLLKIDTDGFDADCIFSAKELLRAGNAMLYWENYVETFAQYQKYKEAYDLLNSENYTSFFVFDNWGNFLCRGDAETLISIMDYVRRTYADCIGNTFTYFDVLACKSEDKELCENAIQKYVEQYPLWRIKIDEVTEEINSSLDNRGV